MQDRNSLVRERFLTAIKSRQFPAASHPLSPADAGVSHTLLCDMFESQVMSRHLDLRSRLMQKQGQSFYTIGSAGHEGNAAIAAALRVTDMAFLHYRSGAFMLQRSKQLDGQTPLYDMLLSFAASSEDPVSGGRHKVLGSKALNVPPQTSTIASHLPKAMGTAYSIALARRLEVQDRLPDDSIVLCNFGDASANHSTAQGAINAAAWTSYQSIPMPVLMVCEDNGLGISTPTPDGWIAANFRNRPGLKYFYCDGLDLLDTYRTAAEAADYVRKTRKPAFLHMRTVRLLGHAGSDAEFVYRDNAQIERCEAQDPLLHSARTLLEHSVLDETQITKLYLDIEQQIERVAVVAGSRPRLTSAEQVKASLLPESQPSSRQASPTAAQRAELFSHDKHNLDKPQHMAKLINWALADILQRYPRTVMCGEDIGRKGGVYNVTSKLIEKFGSHRVINTLLDEQSILGLAIGLAHNGILPIPEIQFLAYVHNAEDQIRGEAATLSFFSNRQFSNPMVIRIAGLAYQKGFGGHFHNDNSLAVFRDIPGIVIACPSNGADAVKMLRGAVKLADEQQRVVVFIEPIALYMTRDLHETGDGMWAFDYPKDTDENILMPGELGQYGDGKDLCILTYGNGFYLSCKAQRSLQAKGINASVIDIRWLAPLPEAALLDAIKSHTHVLVVDECRHTGSLSEALMTMLSEYQQQQGGQLATARLTAEDSFVPLGSASYTVLPSVEQIITAAQTLLVTDSAEAANE
ncbi:dehydrogenase E1 component subunit alpha/beta [Aestuariibacter salexigens]|uniref:dehydrogenase E1 component subunit alpha/beta n=1 Tax=Aestuariibacter salexigens TaxID=226010 RepID=UPI0004199AB1|nr:thiamine pyrophosphate-dependent enzyme [Aestuariibacter salexigens]